MTRTGFQITESQLFGQFGKLLCMQVRGEGWTEMMKDTALCVAKSML